MRNPNNDAKFNPSGFARSNRPDTTRVLIKDVYRSVANTQIKYMLENQFKVRVFSEVKYCYLRNNDKELTHCKNCDRYCYVYTEDLKVPLPRVAKFGEWQCRIFHDKQLGPTIKECNNCYRSDHFGRNCTYPKCCRICKNEGHEPGSIECEFHEKQEDTIAFGGGGEGDIFSNHYPCKFTYKHVDYDNVEQCWFFQKAMLCSQPKIAREIYNSHDAKHAKRLSKRIRCAPDWDSSTIGINLMKDILITKFTHVQECHEGLKSAYFEKQALVEAVPTYDTFWGSGLTPEQTLNTERSKWPGKNKLGCLLEEVAVDLFGEPDWPENGLTPTENSEEMSGSENESENTQSETVEVPENQEKTVVNADHENPEIEHVHVNENVSISDNENASESDRPSRKHARVAKLSSDRRYRSTSPSRSKERSPRSKSVKRVSSPGSKIPQKCQKTAEKIVQNVDVEVARTGRTIASSDAPS